MTSPPTGPPPSGPYARATRRVLRRRPSKTVEDSRMTLTEHLQELRSRLLKAIIAVGVVSLVIGIWGYQPVFDVLLRPYQHLPRRLKGISNGDLIFTQVGGAFIVRLKVSLIAGVILSAPIWLYQLWAFIAPGLHRRERRWSLTFVTASLVLFAAGASVAYLVLGKALDVLLGFGGNGVSPLIDVGEYLSFITTVLVIFGFSFEFPLLLVMLNFAGILSSGRLRRSRRVIVFCLFAFAAVATPTQDPFTMLALAIPLCLLFEAAVLIARWHDRAKARREAAESFADLPDDVASPAPGAAPWTAEQDGFDPSPGSGEPTHYADST